MKKIGEGYFYEVFDCEDGRVLKKKRTFNRIAEHGAWWQKILAGIMWCNSQFYGTKRSDRTVKMIRSLVANHERVADLLAHPIFVSDTDYTQDKVIVLKSLLKQSTFAEGQVLIDRYIQTIIESWKYGFADRVYKFSTNSGVAADGTVVLFDFNECTFSKEEVLKDVISKRWKRSGSLRNIDAGLKAYYFKQMELYIAKDSLDLWWGKYLKT